MKPETFTLTAKDFTLLEAMHERLPAGDPLAQILKRKIDGATVMFPDDAPAHVATLGSRLLFREDGGEPQTRILADDAAPAPDGRCVPVTTALGLALVGLAEGQSFSYADADGDVRSVRLEAVLRQPEAARNSGEGPHRDEARQPAAPERRRPAFRVISGGYDGAPAPAPAPAARRPGWTPPDDPGPSAA